MKKISLLNSIFNNYYINFLCTLFVFFSTLFLLLHYLDTYKKDIHTYNFYKKAITRSEHERYKDDFQKNIHAFDNIDLVSILNQCAQRACVQMQIKEQAKNKQPYFDVSLFHLEISALTDEQIFEFLYFLKKWFKLNKGEITRKNDMIIATFEIENVQKA